MKNKKEFLEKLSKILDEVEDDEAEIEYCSLNLSNYNTKPESKLCYFNIDIELDNNTKEFKINDRSEPFKCTMEGGDDCTERGYCNGDC